MVGDENPPEHLSINRLGGLETQKNVEQIQHFTNWCVSQNFGGAA